MAEKEKKLHRPVQENSAKEYGFVDQKECADCASWCASVVCCTFNV